MQTTIGHNYQQNQSKTSQFLATQKAIFNGEISITREEITKVIDDVIEFSIHLYAYQQQTCIDKSLEKWV